MATLYVTEYPSLTADATAGGGVLLPKGPALAHQAIAISGVSAQSAAFSNNTRIIRVATDAVCAVEIGGTGPVAIVAAGGLGSQRMPANGPPEFYAVNPGDKLAVITTT